ncbi:MSMEG_4193 family putative phosphomutase [Gephyromycinifex aptenodytis]|uniref:MSMEG_4193 family putative phosphomutase n=1 Tax=Gephyromycinifex aptenodytis TaxID=2716227 RepID=UPI00144814D9|nr:MSMEG_4193 family putative phosphomutase [Gephyromycinifex aptenodytis]
MSTCLLVRHGRTTANSSGVLAGWTPGVELDETGRAAVGDLSRRLSGLPIARIVSSPLTRCLQTADILRSQAFPQIQVQELDALGECWYGAWTGRALSELAQEPLWRTVQDHPSAARFPEDPKHRGESIAEMSARAVAGVRAIDAEVEAEHGPNALWLAVSHGDVIKAILADAAGSHLDQFQRFMVAPASLQVVRYTQRRPFLLRLGDTGADLSALMPPAETAANADAAVGGGA